MMGSTTLFLAAGRFGLAPTSNAHTKAGTKLYQMNDSGVSSNDPAGTHLTLSVRTARQPICDT